MKQRIMKICLRLMTMALLVLGLSCLLSPTAQAQTLDEWNRSCRRKTICETKIYSADATRVITTIPANTYVQVHGSTDKWAHISYRTASGQSGQGLADPACIGYAVISFTNADGERDGLQELEYFDRYGNNPPPGGVLDKPLPGGNGETVDTPVSSESKEPTDQATASGSAGSGKTNSAAKSTANKTTASAVNTDVLYQGGKVRVSTWGFHSSVIIADGREQTVLTRDLTFSDGVDAGKRLAYIHAPRTGRCYLRAKASDKGDILDKCPAGTIVQVVKYGKSYCQIVFEGQIGYVQTACLQFADPDAAPITTHALSYNGKTTGAGQVPVRSAESNDSSIVVKLRSGTVVEVYARNGSWYEVEHDGLHGFVHKNFLLLDE